MSPASRKKAVIALAAVVVLAAGGAAAVLHFKTDAPRDGDCRRVDRAPKIHPDYADVVFPPNIAPLNFFVDEPGTRFCARITSAHGRSIEVLSTDGKIQIPLAAWQTLLQANRGEKLQVDVYVKGDDGAWSRFGRITNEIAREDIDPYLVYRLLPPIYSRIWDIGIYRRNLGNFEVAPLLRGEKANDSCINCHSFNKGSPDSMLIQIRDKQHCMGPVINHDGKLVKFNTIPNMKAAPTYPAWHPSGRAIAFSYNTVRQFYHTIGEGRDVYDLASRLVVYRFDTNRISSCPSLCSSDKYPTYPTWSSDGKYLYYCCRGIMPIDRYNEVRYDLMRIAYDIDTGKFGEPEMILAAEDVGKSIVLPRISPDGRYLVFTMLDYGNWPVLRPSADLYVMDLQTRQYRPMTFNSPQSESWHMFSTNGRWLVFSSKRGDGLLARPYFSYFDADGKEHKPVLMPQEDPTYYDGLVRTFNVPELVTGVGSRSEEDFSQAEANGGILMPDVDPSAIPTSQPTSQPGPQGTPY